MQELNEDILDEICIKLMDEINKLKLENSSLKSGVLYQKSRGDKMESLYLNSDKHLQNLLKEMENMERKEV